MQANSSSANVWAQIGLPLMSALALLGATSAYAQADPLKSDATRKAIYEKVTSAPQRHQASVEISAPVTEIYSYISDSNNWVVWFPPYQSVELSADGARRTFTFADGTTTLTEELVIRNQPHAFGWSFAPDNPLGVTDHLGLLTLEATGEQVSVTLTTFYNHPDPSLVSPQFEGGGQLILSKISERFN